MAIITHTYLLPAHWASYLINGDHSGLTDAEQAQADAAIDWIGKGGPVDVSEGEFSWTHDVQHITGRLGGDVATYTFLTKA